MTDEEALFHTQAGVDVKCPLMYLKAQLAYKRITPTNGEPYELMFLETNRSSGDKSTVCGMVALPQKGGSIQGMMHDIAQREREIRQTVLNHRKKFPSSKAILQMPRLEKNMAALEISNIVQRFGLGGMYTGGAFDKMVQYEDGSVCRMEVGAILHATYLKWNEEGAEAAAATAVVVNRSLSAMEPRIPEMRCDRPFVSYLIDVPNDETSPSVLFSMVVSDDSCFDWTEPEVGSMAIRG